MDHVSQNVRKGSKTKTLWSEMCRDMWNDGWQDVGKVLSKQGRTKSDLGGLSVMDAGSTKVQGSEPFAGGHGAIRQRA